MANATKWYWPAVDTRRNIGFAIEEAFWAAALAAAGSALLTTLVVVESDTPALTALGYLDAVVFGIIAFGIRRKSRVWAILGLVLYASNVVCAFVVAGFRSPIIPAFFILAFVHGIRGTFAYHKLPALPANLPSVKQGFQALRQSPNQETGDPQRQSREESPKS